MVTKRAQKSSTAHSVNVQLFVADDVRLESDGKVTAVGLYTNQVIVAMADQVPEGGRIVLGGLSLLLSIWGTEGHQRVSVKYHDDSVHPEATVIGENDYEFPSTTSALNIVARFPIFQTGSFGTKRVYVRVGDHESSLSFEVSRGEQRALDAAKVRMLTEPSNAEKIAAAKSKTAVKGAAGAKRAPLRK
jgi:hypothetical protein